MTLLLILCSFSPSSRLPRPTVRSAPCGGHTVQCLEKILLPRNRTTNSCFGYESVVRSGLIITSTTRRLFPSLPDLSQWNVAGRLPDLPLALWPLLYYTAFVLARYVTRVQSEVCSSILQRTRDVMNVERCQRCGGCVMYSFVMHRGLFLHQTPCLHHGLCSNNTINGKKSLSRWHIS